MTVRQGPSGPLVLQSCVVAQGTYLGSQTAPTDPPQTITVGFRPLSIQIAAQQAVVAGSPPPVVGNTAIQIGKNASLPDGDVFIQFATSAGITPDQVTFTDTGFIVNAFANAAPGLLDPTSPGTYFFTVWGGARRI